MNLDNYEETKAVKYSELVLNKKYFKVWSGTIYKVEFITHLPEDKIKILLFGKGSNVKCSVYECHLSDNGFFDAPACSYKNYLNRWFHTEEDAIKYLNSLEYRSIFQRHKNQMLFICNYL